MEIYKRKVGYEDIGRTSDLIITATTIYFPFMLTQDFEDMGIYADAKNQEFEVIDLSGKWNLSNNNVVEKRCLILNKCVVNFTSIPLTYFNANNGSLSASIVTSTECPSPQTVLWSGPEGFTSTNLTAGNNNLKSGNYTLKVIDGDCNITYANYFLSQPQRLSFNLSSTNSQINASTTGGCDGSASITVVGGNPPYTYKWYSGSTIYGTSSSITNLCAGQYSVEITDSKNEIVSTLFNINEPSAVSGSVISTINLNCNGDNKGEIKLEAKGGISTPNGYKFVLSGVVNKTITGSTGTATFSNLVAGTYNITIYDSVGNSTTLSTTLTQPIAVTSSISSQNISCYGLEDGSMDINVTGGLSPYNVDIKKDGQPYIGQSVTSPYSLSDLDVGSYEITVKDVNGCEAPTSTVVIKQQPRLDIKKISSTSNFNGYSLPCFGSTTGITFQTSYYTDSTTLTPSSNPIAYYLDGVHMLPNMIGLVTSKTLTMGEGTHTITAVNTSTNCSATTTVTLTQPPSPLSISYGVISVHSGSTNCNTCGTGINRCKQGVIDINGGVAPYMVTWNGGNQTGTPVSTSSNSTITSKPDCDGTTINVTVTDNNGCSVGPINITLTI